MKTVDRGAELLDQEAPGWEKKIDLDTLDLASSSCCVLGQVYRVNQNPAFFRGIRKLGLAWGDGPRYGFMVWGPGRWENLTEAWRREIRRRLGRA